MKTLLSITGLVLIAISAAAQQPVGIDQMMPTLEQLGAGWASNRFIVLVDPLSLPSVVTNANEGPGWLKLARSVVGKDGREAYGAIRCFYGSNSVVVWLNRYKSKADIRPDWGTDPDTKLTVDRLPKVGEEVRFHQRDGIHNNIAFRRGSYLVDVEGIGAPIERLKQMAEVLDSNLVKALGRAAPQGPQPAVPK